nr:hypothetical protein Iba_chr09dCG10170 [Ipomoea batatas]
MSKRGRDKYIPPFLQSQILALYVAVVVEGGNIIAARIFGVCFWFSKSRIVLQLPESLEFIVRIDYTTAAWKRDITAIGSLATVDGLNRTSREAQRASQGRYLTRLVFRAQRYSCGVRFHGVATPDTPAIPHDAILRASILTAKQTVGLQAIAKIILRQQDTMQYGGQEQLYLRVVEIRSKVRPGHELQYAFEGDDSDALCRVVPILSIFVAMLTGTRLHHIRDISARICMDATQLSDVGAVGLDHMYLLRIGLRWRISNGVGWFLSLRVDQFAYVLGTDDWVANVIEFR